MMPPEFTQPAMWCYSGPPRKPTDAWHQYRNARIQKRQPGGDTVLYLESLGWSVGEFGINQAVDRMSVGYLLEVNGVRRALDDLQWVDWDVRGRFLAATRYGKLQIRDMEANQTLFENDLSLMDPNPTAAPDSAGRR